MPKMMPASKWWVLLMLNLVLSHPTDHRANTEQTSTQVDPSNDHSGDETEIRRLMIELTKLELLEKLHLTEVPQLDVRLEPTPRPVVPVLQGRQRDDPGVYRSGGTRDTPRHSHSNLHKLALLGHQEFHPDDDHLSHSRHFLFRPESTIYSDMVQSASLWVAPYQNITERLMMYVSDTMGDHRGISELPGVPGHILAKARLGRNKPEWITSDVTSSVKYWLKQNSGNLRLSLSCVGSTQSGDNLQNVPIKTDPEHQPFLVIEMGRKKRGARRQKRSMGRDGDCALHNLYFNFSEIGWDSWLIQPRGYNANYCMGSCPDYRLSSHSYVRMDVTKANPRNSTLRELLAPCCSPTRKSSISIIYRTSANQIAYATLQNMVVEQCECL